MYQLMQNYQHLNAQNFQIPSPTTNSVVFFPTPNNPNMYFRPQINTHEVDFSHREPGTPIGFMSESQVPQFPTQIGGEENHSVKKRTRELFTREEDTFLMQSWLNVSKNPVVEVDQKSDSFWVRITANYN